MPDQRVAGSFRDPAGFVFTRDGTLYRQVSPSYGPVYEQVRDSGLYAALVGRGLLVDHEEVALAPAEPPAFAVLRPEPVAFVSFPYEWCPGQLRDAALATLDAQLLALDHGMCLRDASAYNVAFRGGCPVLIDTLSFAPLVPGRPWAAYGQFCEHFLAPLALQCLVDVRLAGLLRANLDGVPLDLASAMLPVRTRLAPGLGVHLHAHARSRRRHAGDPEAAARASGRMSPGALRGLVESLRATVERLTWAPVTSAWRDYDTQRPSYSDESFDHKRELVAKLLAEVAPSTVWDLGANTGRFSQVAADAGARVVAWEADPSAVEVAWAARRGDPAASVLPLVADLTNPSPALGWEHRERPSLTDRGPVDAVMALALVHHLAVGGNVPLERVAAWLRRLAAWALVEWVPKHDPMVQRLLAGRDDVFDDYTQEGFERAVAVHFSVERREPLRGSPRTLYLLRGRAGDPAGG